VSITPAGGKIEPNKANIQLTHLEPYFRTEEMMKRRNFFKKNSNLGEFYLVTPYVPGGGGKAQGHVSEQWKKKTIVQVSPWFPSALRRLPIISRREEYLNPVENAIEDVVNRIVLLQHEIQKQPPVTRTLSQVLQGSVLTQVNGGISDIVKSFLTPSKQWEHASIEKLVARLQEFIEYAGQGLQIHATLVDQATESREQLMKFQAEMENGYQGLVMLINNQSEQALNGGGDVAAGMSSLTSAQVVRPQASPQVPKASPMLNVPDRSAGFTGSLRGVPAERRLTADEQMMRREAGSRDGKRDGAAAAPPAKDKK